MSFVAFSEEGVAIGKLFRGSSVVERSTVNYYAASRGKPGSKKKVNCLEAQTRKTWVISSQAQPKFWFIEITIYQNLSWEGSETIPKGSTPRQARGKRLPPKLIIVW